MVKEEKQLTCETFPDEFSKPVCQLANQLCPDVHIHNLSDKSVT